MKKEMNKKGKILSLFNSMEWHTHSDGLKSKTISGNLFHEVGLNYSYEYGESYNDVIYARRIFQRMGYSVGIGSAFHIYDKSTIKTI